MLKKLLFLFWGIASCVLLGCNVVTPQPELGNLATLTPLPRPFMTASPQKTLPTSTPTKLFIPTTTLLPSPAPAISESMFKTSCVDLIPDFSPDISINGYIVLGGYGIYQAGFPEPVLINPKTSDIISLTLTPEEQIAYITVSPNHYWLAYQKYDTQLEVTQLVVATANGLPYQITQWEKTWTYLIRWLDDAHLMIWEAPNNIMLLNPFTNEKQELPSNYPDIYDVYPGPDWEEFSSTPTIFDVMLKRVIYPKSQNGFNGIALWNLQTNQEITYITGTLDFGYRPLWSPDGQQFVINNSIMSSYDPEATQKQELFSVHRDGEVERLTYLTSAYSSVEFGHYEWSPNGRYLAFWLEVAPLKYTNTYDQLSYRPEQQIWRLAVLDMNTRQVINYCIPAGYALAPLVWSPDSSQIAVEVVPDLSRRPVLLIDLQHKVAIKIMDASWMPPTGWLGVTP